MLAKKLGLKCHQVSDLDLGFGMYEVSLSQRSRALLHSDATCAAPRPGFDPESAPRVRVASDFDFSHSEGPTSMSPNAFHVIKDLLLQNAVLATTFRVAWSLTQRSAAKRTTTQIS